MSTPLVQIRCTPLRSKSSYGAFGEFHDELLDLSGGRYDPTGASRPWERQDDHYVHRSVCLEGRSCWESCESDALISQVDSYVFVVPK